MMEIRRNELAMKTIPFGLLILALAVIGCSNSGDQASGSAGPSVAANTPAASSPATSPTPETSGSQAAGGYAGVQAIFTANCSCHTGGRPKAGLNLTSYDGLMKGTNEGPVVKAGDPEGSLIIQALTGTGSAKAMPPGRKLSDADIKTISDWIKAGAKNG